MNLKQQGVGEFPALLRRTFCVSRCQVRPEFMPQCSAQEPSESRRDDNEVDKYHVRDLGFLGDCCRLPDEPKLRLRLHGQLYARQQLRVHGRCQCGQRDGHQLRGHDRHPFQSPSAKRHHVVMIIMVLPVMSTKGSSTSDFYSNFDDTAHELPSTRVWP